MCEHCLSFWTACKECGKGLCKLCTTSTPIGDMCPACAEEYEEKEND